MAGFWSAKMKRKDLEEVNDEFSEFSLSSPARKIRRLDAELSPIMEEEEHAVHLLFEHQLPKEQMSSTMSELGSVMTDAMPPLHVNDERAVVLYKPMDTPLVLSPSSSNVSFKVDLKLINGLKNQVFWPGNPNPTPVEKAPMDDKPAPRNDSFAVVPWVPSLSPVTTHGMGDPESSGCVLEELPMETEEEAGSASMEVEEDKEHAGSSGVGGGGEAFHKWQQHCMTPQLPQNTSTSIMWSW